MPGLVGSLHPISGHLSQSYCSLRGRFRDYKIGVPAALIIYGTLMKMDLLPEDWERDSIEGWNNAFCEEAASTCVCLSLSRPETLTAK